MRFTRPILGVTGALAALALAAPAAFAAWRRLPSSRRGGYRCHRSLVRRQAAFAAADVSTSSVTARSSASGRFGVSPSFCSSP